MEGQTPPNSDIIQRDCDLFASVDHLEEILGSSPGTFSRLVRFHQGRTFVSVVHISDALASISTDRFEIVHRPAEAAGAESLALRLVDNQGDEVPTLDTLRLKEWALHSSASSEDGQQPGDDGPRPSSESDHDIIRHDTPTDNGSQVKGRGQLEQLGQLEQRHEDTPPRSQNLNEDIDGGFDDEDGLFVNQTVLSDSQPRHMRVEPASSQNNADHAQIDLTRHPKHYDETVVQKLRELNLVDLGTINRLLENRSPLALNPLSKTRDQFVHLCTLASDKVFSIKMFRDLHAYSERLEFASLNDPALLDQPLTGYQKNELSMILRDILATDSAQQCWSSAYLVPRPRRDDYRRIIPQPPDLQRKLFYEYATMAHFKRELNLLVTNVARFHGSHHEVTAAAERTVAAIAARMDDAAAVGIADTQEGLFHGLVREVTLSQGALSSASLVDDAPLAYVPRFVLPLGQLHASQDADNDAAAEHSLLAANNAIVFVDVASPRKAVWLYANDPPESCYLVMLTDDITHWKLSSGGSPGRGSHGDGGLMKRNDPDTRRNKLTKEHRASRIDLPPGAVVLFKRASKTQLVKAVQEGWGWGSGWGTGDALAAGVIPETPAGKKKNKRVYTWDSDEGEEWVPATTGQHRRGAKKPSTPKRPRRLAKVPRTV